MDTTEDFSFGFGKRVRKGKKRSNSNKKKHTYIQLQDFFSKKFNAPIYRRASVNKSHPSYGKHRDSDFVSLGKFKTNQGTRHVFMKRKDQVHGSNAKHYYRKNSNSTKFGCCGRSTGFGCGSNSGCCFGEMTKLYQFASPRSGAKFGQDLQQISSPYQYQPKPVRFGIPLSPLDTFQSSYTQTPTTKTTNQFIAKFGEAIHKDRNLSTKFGCKFSVPGFGSGSGRRPSRFGTRYGALF